MQTVSSFISTQKYIEKRDLKYSVVYYQEHSLSENNLKEESGEKKYVLLQSKILQCHWSTGLNCYWFEFILLKNT